MPADKGRSTVVLDKVDYDKKVMTLLEDRDTNDLLRGIESTLHTRASASSFITMSKFCIKALLELI